MSDSRQNPDAKRFRVLGIGTACIDYLMTVEDYPGENSQVYASALEVQGGGNCGNTLVGLARLGVQAAIVTRIGDDDIGRQILDSLQSEGVDTGFAVCTGDRSPVSFVVVGQHRQSRTVIHRKGVAYGTPFPFAPAWLEGVDLVYLGGRFDTEAEVAAEAKRRGIYVVVEAEHTGTRADRLFPVADAVITSQDFHKQFFRNERFAENLQRINTAGPAVAAVTLGVRGAILTAENEIIKMDAFDAPIKDTTGAGDAFAAGFIYATLLEMPMGHRLAFAQRLAARNCGFPGARKGLADYREASAWLTETS